LVKTVFVSFMFVFSWHVFTALPWLLYQAEKTTQKSHQPVPRPTNPGGRVSA